MAPKKQDGYGTRRVAQAEVAKKTGIAESTISEVSTGKRKLNRRQIGKLARYFKIAPGRSRLGSEGVSVRDCVDSVAGLR